MSVAVWVNTDKGLKRENNQDSFLFNEKEGLFVVADGMGGHLGGEVASKMAAETFVQTMIEQKKKITAPRERIQFSYQTASAKIYDHANSETSDLHGMGTTMVAVYYTDQSLYIANVGDSRVYLFRQPYFWQLTEDHSLVNEQLRAGLVTEAEFRNLMGRNVITRSVGYERDVIVDVLERPFTRGDQFLLCSDGLSSLVPDAQIAEILRKHKGEEAIRNCINAALARGGDDNVTVMMVNLKY